VVVLVVLAAAVVMVVVVATQAQHAAFHSRLLLALAACEPLEAAPGGGVMKSL
jgi:hypothetical protein